MNLFEYERAFFFPPTGDLNGFISRGNWFIGNRIHGV